MRLPRTSLRVVPVLSLVGITLLCAACIGGPVGAGDPGQKRLHAIAADPLVASPLPPGYRVIRRQLDPTHWEGNGAPFGQPGWTEIDVQVTFRTDATRAAVVSLFESRAVQARWKVDPAATKPPHWWGWTKQEAGYSALAGLIGSSGRYEIGISAPPIGPNV